MKKENKRNEKFVKESWGESGEMGGGGQNMAFADVGRGQAQTFNPK